MQAVLLCGDEFHATLAGVRGLRTGGHLPYLAVCRYRTYAAYSRATAGTVHVPDPDDDPIGYATAVGAAARTVGAAAILPGNESALLVLSGHPEAVGCAIPMGAPPAATVMTAVDKTAVTTLAQRAGFRTPPTRVATRAELMDEASRLEYPLILKPPRSKLPTQNGSLRYVTAQRIDSPERLLQALKDAPEASWVIQPFFSATLAAVSGVAWEGALVCAVHQVAHRIWPPYAGYSSYAETVAPDKSLEQAARAFLAQLRWSGVFQMQFVRTQNDRFFIDFNPRLYGSMALATAAGLNLPAIWADLVLGREPVPADYRSGIRYRLEHNDVRALWALAAAGSPRAAVRGLLPRRHTVHGIATLRDPGPLRALALKAAQRARGAVAIRPG